MTRGKNPVLEAIHTRRSVRTYTGEPVTDELVREILKAGAWAPSGLNNQPWRFALVRGDGPKDELAGLTRYASIVRRADLLIAVFLDENASYDAEKDRQGIGACIQNMLLAAHSLGLGAVWLGEILKSRDRVREVLGLGERLNLMAVVALGHPARTDQTSTRKELKELIVKEV